MGSPLPDVLNEEVLGNLPRREAERLREVWTLAGPDEPTPAPSEEETEKALAELRASRSARARNSSPDRAPARGTRSERRAKRWTTGLGLLLLLVAAGVLWWTRPVERLAPPGEHRSLTLPDGSAVELNSGSELRYRRHVLGARRVELKGEAFFEVAERSSPFVVETFNAEVRVTGTRFGVRAWPSEPEARTTVALRAGRVTLAPAGTSARSVRMTPGEARSVLTTAGTKPPRIAPAEVSVGEATAWRRGALVFKNARLDAVLGEVERRFGTGLRLQQDSLRRQRLNLALRRPEGAEAVIRDLALALGLRYRQTATGFEIYAPEP